MSRIVITDWGYKPPPLEMIDLCFFIGRSRLHRDHKCSRYSEWVVPFSEYHRFSDMKWCKKCGRGVEHIKDRIATLKALQSSSGSGEDQVSPPSTNV